MVPNPIVSVLLCTRNGETFLRQSLDSMAAQTFTDWEWVIVDDGSTDGSPRILAEYQQRFPERVRVFRNETNLGLTASLNRGLGEARGLYIARIDDDDSAHPERLARQVAVMQRDPELLLLGTGGDRVDEEGNRIKEYMPHFDAVRLRIDLCWFNPFMHASVMFRRRLVDGSPVMYDESYSTAQDYALWARLALAGRIEVLPENLMTYRERQGSVTGDRRALQLESTRRVSEKFTRALTVGTELEGASPDELRDLIDEPELPAGRRLKRVKLLFDIAAHSPFIHSREKRRAFMNWAEPFLDSQKWRSLFASGAGELLCTCGRCGVGYAVRRMVR